MVSLQGLRARYDEVFLPLYGAHQAQNAAVALAAVESFLRRRAAGRRRSCGRRSPRSPRRPGSRSSGAARRSLLDAAHNPHGAEATAAALEDSFVFSPLIGVIGVMADKDAEGLLAAFEPHLAHVVCTQNATPRAMPAETLAVTAREVFGEDRVTVEPRLADAIDAAAALAEAGEAVGESLGSGAVLVTGSVVTAGEARTMLRSRGMTSVEARRDRRCGSDGPGALSPAGHVRRGAQPRGDHARPDHPGDDHRRRRRPSGAALAVGLGLAVACLVVAGLLRGEWAYALGWVLQVGAIALGVVVPLMFFLGVAVRAAVGDGVLPRPQDRAGARRGVRRPAGAVRLTGRLSPKRARWCSGELDAEAVAVDEVRVEQHRAAVRLGDPLADRQPDPDPGDAAVGPRANMREQRARGPRAGSGRRCR